MNKASLTEICNSDTAYLIGAMHDGFLYEKDYCISIGQKSEEWLKYLQKLFEKNFNVKSKIRKWKFKNAFELRIFSKELFFFIKNNFYNEEIPRIIRENKKFWIPYVSGYFDAEGHCTKPSTFAKTGKKKISLHQNSKESLEFVKEAFESYGIKSSKIYLQRGRKCHALYVQSKNGIIKFSNTFSPVQKRQAVDELVKILCTGDTKAGSSRNVP